MIIFSFIVNTDNVMYQKIKLLSDAGIFSGLCCLECFLIVKFCIKFVQI